MQTRAGLERAVSRSIKTVDIDVFYPTYKREIYISGRKEEIIRPLFPLYTFANFDLDDKECDWGRILRAVGVQTILGVRRNAGRPMAPMGEKRGNNHRFGEKPRPVPVPDWVITELKLKMELGGGHVKLNEEPPPKPLERLQPYQRVRVTQGAFDGFEGLVDQDKKTRVWVLLDILGKERRTLIDREALTEIADQEQDSGPIHPFHGPLHPFNQ